MVVHFYLGSSVHGQDETFSRLGLILIPPGLYPYLIIIHRKMHRNRAIIIVCEGSPRDLAFARKEGGRMKIRPYCIRDGEDFHLRDIRTDDDGGLAKGQTIDEALARNIRELTQLQDVLFAHNKYGVLVILQAMDAAGKDGVIKHIMSGLNPQGVEVTPFKVPSAEELDHDYLWRSHEHLPERGNIAIFNRSYYEDVLVVKVHNLLAGQNLPEDLVQKDIWQERYRQLRDFERYMQENGIVVIKFFLHVSREEQAKRLLARIDDPDKNWKFSAGDLNERKYWQQYQEAYEEMIRATATASAPWYIIPADRKWYSRLLISEILVRRLKGLPLKYPGLGPEEKAALAGYRQELTAGA
jgi:PPK2 family polyphosphate:nucleotide phosphotransferase